MDEVGGVWIEWKAFEFMRAFISICIALFALHPDVGHFLKRIVVILYSGVAFKFETVKSSLIYVFEPNWNH